MQLEQLWRRPIFENSGDVAESIYPVQVGNVALTTKLTDHAPPELYAIDWRQGSILWQALDTSCTGNIYYNMNPFISGQNVVIPCGRTIKCLDAGAGEVQWVYQYAAYPEPFIEPYTDKTFLQAANDWDERASHIYEVNSISGNVRLIYSTNWPDSSKLLIRTPVRLGDGQLLFSSIAMRYGTNETTSKWHLLDEHTAEIIAEGVAFPKNLNGYGVTKQPLAMGTRAYLIAFDNVFCISTAGKKELWRKILPRDMLTSAPILSEEGLYCPMEDGFLYKLNLDDGHIVWKAKIATTPGRAVIAGGYLFIVGGSDGVLYVISTKDGKIEKSLKAPNHDFVKNQFFRRFIGIDQEGEALMLFDGNSFRGYKIWK